MENGAQGIGFTLELSADPPTMSVLSGFNWGGTMVRNVLISAVLLASLQTAAAAQIFNPPPIKSAGYKTSEHRFSGQLGFASCNGLEIEIGSSDVDFDY